MLGHAVYPAECMRPESQCCYVTIYTFCSRLVIRQGRWGTHTLVEVVSGVDDSLAAAQKATDLVSKLRCLCLLQTTCIQDEATVVVNHSCV